MNLSICIISNGYPSDMDTTNSFLKTLIDTWVDLGVNCTVISLESVSHALIRKRKIKPLKEVVCTSNNTYTVFHPRVITFSNNNSLKRLELGIERSAVLSLIRKNEIEFDLIYCHFLTPSGLIGSYIAQKTNKPYFLAYGEASDKMAKHYQTKELSKSLKIAKGIIAVSTKNMQDLYSIKRYGMEHNSSKIVVIPNATNTNVFYPMDKNEVRRKLGIDENVFIVSFVGSFDNRKGIQRLNDAIKDMNDIYAFYIGGGSISPKGENILFCGKLPNLEIPSYLNASDVFVLPTLNEGCPNAVIEAMACGLPVISSDREFNDDILDASSSIRVNPESIDEIRSAIIKLKNDYDYYRSMKQNAMKRAQDFSIVTRANRILQFMQEKMGQ